MTSITLLTLIFFVALTYASVGHGGASGYLAVMTLLGAAPASMATSALLLNLIVAGIACVTFWGAARLSPQWMRRVLALVLVIASDRVVLTNG